LNAGCQSAFIPMDSRHPRIALTANAVALLIFFAGAINMFGGVIFGHPGEKFRFIGTFYAESWAARGWSTQEWIALVMIISLIGLNRWARKEHTVPTVHSHGSSAEQYAALEELPTMVSLDNPEEFVNPNTASVIASIVGSGTGQSSNAVSSAIGTLSSGEIGRTSAEAASVNKIDHTKVHTIETKKFESVTSNYNSLEVTSVPLPELPTDDEIPSMLDLDELISDESVTESEKMDLPELPDLSSI